MILTAASFVHGLAEKIIEKKSPVNNLFIRKGIWLGMSHWYGNSYNQTRMLPALIHKDWHVKTVVLKVVKSYILINNELSVL